MNVFVSDPLDIAPRARRQPAAGWLVLIVASAVLVAAGLQLGLAWRASLAAGETRAAAARAERALARQQLAASEQAAREPAENGRARIELHRKLGASWSGLFAVLEAASLAVEGRATVVALAPVRMLAQTSEVALTAVAGSTPAMMDYLRALERQPAVQQLQLVQQQPVTGASGAQVRFQLSLLLLTASPGSAAAAPVGKGAAP